MQLETRGNTFYARGRKNGEDIRISLKTTDEATAQARLHAVEQVGHLPTVGDIIDRYLGRTSKQVGQTERIYLSRIKDVIGGEVAEELRPSLVQEAITEPRLESGLKPGSVRRELVCLQSALNYAHEYELMSKKIKLHKPSVDDERDRWATQEERDRMIACADKIGTDFKATLTALFYTGGRLGEVLNAKEDDEMVVNGERSIVLSNRKTKGGKVKKRAVPILPALAEVLQSRNGWWTPAHTGKQWSRSEFYRRWYDCCDLALMDDFHPHDARRSFASHLIMSGADIITVAAMTGHSQLQMLKRYSHFAQDSLRKTLIAGL